MTGWLSGWLRDIVLIILFAAFVDLLIPNNALQRYVKIAVSLMILLTILSPVIKLLRAEVDVRQAADEAFVAADGGFPALPAVLEAGGRLKLHADSRSARLVEGQIAEMIRDAMLREHGVNVLEVAVTIGEASGSVSASSETASAAAAEIQHIRLRIGSDEARIARPPDSRIAEVGKVEPIAVAVKLDERDGESGRNTPTLVSTARTDSDETQSNHYVKNSQIRQHIGQWLGIDESKVVIVWADEEP